MVLSCGCAMGIKKKRSRKLIDFSKNWDSVTRGVELSMLLFFVLFCTQCETVKQIIAQGNRLDEF